LFFVGGGVLCGALIFSLSFLSSPETGGESEAALRAGAEWTPVAAPYHCEPVNPDSTVEVRTLLRKLCEVSGKGILSGQHNFTSERSRSSDLVYSITGKHPAIWSSDFGFTSGDDKDSIDRRDLMIEEAKKQGASGSLVCLSWHAVRPIDDEPVPPIIGFENNVRGKLTDDQWAELITLDTPLHKRWEKYVDTAAHYLSQLQDAHIPVLWRPLHENNGSFFWWGGRPGPKGTQQLYREMFDRLTHVHHLNNLIWVWDQNVPGARFADYFPGQQYVDVVAYDNYGKLLDRYYSSLLKLANGKPIALGEVGHPPSPEVLRSQPKWVWFVIWADRVDGGLKTIYEDSHTINRGDPRLVH
jgi:mannan endo-1,4-beta-mannosidase